MQNSIWNTQSFFSKTYSWKRISYIVSPFAVKWSKYFVLGIFAISRRNESNMKEQNLRIFRDRNCISIPKLDSIASNVSSAIFLYLGKYKRIWYPHFCVILNNKRGSILWSTKEICSNWDIYIYIYIYIYRTRIYHR